jgi:hypothetical protein
MKIIEFDTKNAYTEQAYRQLDAILEFGMNYLPFIFLKKVYMGSGDNKLELQLPRWISKKRMNEIDKDTQELMNDLNWE